MVDTWSRRDASESLLAIHARVWMFVLAASKLRCVRLFVCGRRMQAHIWAAGVRKARLIAKNGIQMALGGYERVLSDEVDHYY